MSESLSAIYLSFNERQKKVTIKQDMLFLSIIWPNYSRLLSKLNKPDQRLCVSVCACAHKPMQDFVGVGHGREEVKSPDL